MSNDDRRRRDAETIAYLDALLADERALSFELRKKAERLSAELGEARGELLRRLRNLAAAEERIAEQRESIAMLRAELGRLRGRGKP